MRCAVTAFLLLIAPLARAFVRKYPHEFSGGHAANSKRSAFLSRLEERLNVDPKRVSAGELTRRERAMMFARRAVQKQRAASGGERPAASRPRQSADGPRRRQRQRRARGGPHPLRGLLLRHRGLLHEVGSRRGMACFGGRIALASSSVSSSNTLFTTSLTFFSIPSANWSQKSMHLRLRLTQ